MHTRSIVSPFRLRRLSTIGTCCLSALLVIFLAKNIPPDLDTGVPATVLQPSNNGPDSSSDRSLEPANHDDNSKFSIDLPSPSAPSLRRARAISDAITRMRCMLLPGCYPDVPCANNQDPMKLPQGKYWEQHSFCTGDLEAASERAKANQQKCLVYSFGIHDSIEWELKMASEFGCDVYAFDPTSKFATNVGPGVTFHKLGLQGRKGDVSQTHSEMYDAIDPEKIRTLGDIRNMLGHQTRQIDILRLDCEGCEWGVLEQLACSDDSELVDQAMVEMHFQKNLGIASDDDLLIAADAIACLEEKRWGLVSLELSGCDPLDAEFTPSMHKIIKQESIFMLLYASFRRVPVKSHFYKTHDPNFDKYTKREVYTMKTEEKTWKPYLLNFQIKNG